MPTDTLVRRIGKSLMAGFDGPLSAEEWRAQAEERLKLLTPPEPIETPEQRLARIGKQNIVVDYDQLSNWLRSKGIRYMAQDPGLQSCFVEVKPASVYTPERIPVVEVTDNKSPNLIECLDVTDCDKAMIKERGYKFRRQINESNGEGSTRDVFYATQTVGNLEREVVVKVPRKEAQVTSINALINRTKKNIDLQEALLSGALKHPNIVRGADSFQLSDERTVNAEDYIEGWSLRSFVKTFGAIRDLERIKTTFGPLIDAVSYSQGQGILHRDITPANAILPKNGGGAILTDWQNAAYKKDIENLAIPTRGGTGCIHPILLNALLTGEPSKATERTEIYSLGATIYEAVTGDNAFDYTLEQNPNGRKVMINGREFSIGVKSGGKNLESITAEDHEARLKVAIKKAPEELQSLLYRMLTTDPKKEITWISEVEAGFRVATTPQGEKFLSKAARYAKVAGVSLAVGFGGILAAYMGLIMENQPTRTEVTLSEVLRTQTRVQYLAEGRFDLATSVRDGAGTEFDKYFKEISGKISQLEGKDYEYTRRAGMNTGLPVDNRLTLSLIRSLKLADKSKIKFNEERLASGVPKNYVVDHVKGMGSDRDDRYLQEPFIQEMWMGRYTQGMYTPGDSIEDVFTKALCSPGQIRQAIAKTQQQYTMKRIRDKGDLMNGLVRIGEVADMSNAQDFSYYPREIKSKGRGLIGKDMETTDYIPGYRDNLDSEVRSTVDRAVVLYLMSDKEGKLDLKKYEAPAQPFPLRPYVTNSTTKVSSPTVKN